METIYKSKRGYDYKYTFKFAGWGNDAQPIYAKYETKFNIAKGVIYLEKFVGYVEENYKEYNSGVRY